MTRKFPLILLFSFLGGVMLLSAADRDIALVYLRNIDDLWSEDEEGAFRLVDNGLDYDDSLSGLWFFKGLYEYDRELFPEAEASLDRAWQSNDWEGGDLDRFIDLYFPLMSRLGKWDKILESEKGTAFHRVNRKSVILAAGWADFYLGRTDEAARRGRKGIDLYPDDWRFYALAVAGGRTEWVQTLLYNWDDDTNVMGRIFERLYKTGTLDSSLYSWYRNRNDRWGNLLMTEEKLRSGGNDSSRIISDYLDTWKPRDLVILRRFYDLADSSAREVLNRYLLEEEGEFSYDGDGDSYPEILLSEGKILQADRDRDVRWDTRIALGEDGNPSLWESSGGDTGNIEYRFYEWPYLKQMVREKRGNSQTFDYLYSRFSFTDDTLLSERAFPDVDNPEVMALTVFILGEDIHIPYHTLLVKCRSINESKSGGPTRKYYVVEGEVIAYEEDPEGQGQFTRQVLIENGRISAARRDLDGDGIFDLFEYYEKGVWSGYAVNYEGNGDSDFFEDWSFIPLKIWDYDGDSLMDGLLTGTYGEVVETVIPHREDPRDIGDYLSWERKFEAQWYR